MSNPDSSKPDPGPALSRNSLTDPAASITLQNILQKPEVMSFAIQSSINAIAFSDLQGKVAFVNQACLQMWGGRHASEMIGLPADFFAWDRKEAEQALNSVLQQGFWEGEIQGRRKDGSHIWVYLSAYQVRDQQQQPICLVCSLIDITQNKKLQQEMQLKEFALQSSINAVAMGNLSGRITYINAAFQHLWGGTREEIIGSSIMSLAWDSQQAERLLQQVLEQGSWFGEISGKNKEKRQIPVQLSASLVRDSAGKPLCLYCSFVDISQQKQIEAELRQAKQELQQKVQERTSSLQQTNQELQEQIQERERMQQTLLQSQQELKEKTKNLQEMNTTLQVLLEKREQDKKDLEQKVLSQVQELILPHLQEMREDSLSPRQETCLQQALLNLQNIVSPFALNLRSPETNLTPSQLKVAELIKQGLTSKQIAEQMQISCRAVEFHRNCIRHRLDLQGKKINLRSYLLSLS
ncbi:MAG: PAS domain-containing protein [Desulfohalobiaceae bacterium]